MANNRMYLKCNVCGKKFMLAKSMGTGFYTPSPMADSLENLLDEFFTKHVFCVESPDADDIIGPEGDFSLEYEAPVGRVKRAKRKVKSKDD